MDRSVPVSHATDAVFQNAHEGHPRPLSNLFLQKFQHESVLVVLIGWDGVLIQCLSSPAVVAANSVDSVVDIDGQGVGRRQ